MYTYHIFLLEVPQPQFRARHGVLLDQHIETAIQEDVLSTTSQCVCANQHKLEQCNGRATFCRGFFCFCFGVAQNCIDEKEAT